jgi:hypothetical protein
VYLTSLRRSVPVGTVSQGRGSLLTRDLRPFVALTLIPRDGHPLGSTIVAVEDLQASSHFQKRCSREHGRVDVAFDARTYRITSPTGHSEGSGP